MKKPKLLYSTIIKYLFSIVITLYSYKVTSDLVPIFAGVLELSMIFFISNMLFKVNKYIANIVNTVLMLLYNIEQVILIFGGSYLTYTMLTNVDSLEALSGHAILYASGFLILLFFSFLPISEQLKKMEYQILSFLVIVILEISVVGLKIFENTPFTNYYSLIQIHQERMDLLNRIGNNEVTENFYKSEVVNATSKPENLPDNPNIVVIFTEGLSERILHDDRGLMANTVQIEDESLSFENYYNHTFATYLGIKGQLYSGYQATNYEDNYLVGMQDVLNDKNYNTTFINTEPNNVDFTKYLKSMNFDEVISPDSIKSTVSDKKAYQYLFETMEEKDKEDAPFFISMYTFGTHLSLDSDDEIFGDGENPNLNKFYNLDIQFKSFIDMFNQSELSKNTIIVFTTDHATYVDADYVNTFGNDRAVGHLDKVPFFIYYNGVTPQRIDVNGRNSLSLVPTILDYVDISEDNYFLGDTLFNNNSTSKLDTIFSSEDSIFTTKDSKIDFLKPEVRDETLDIIEQYYTFKLIK
ncbi:sulfatase-like hydrolase/transferase [Streptococcus pacificus]|uniref:Sulfatase-like hydrolase/transferase n=1 Tax=Streptococcus pacificus TaxID=2740577 RepID=A0ABS0ZH55_9STRE|nr:sulfatase-like hydrolase/transferase [Streptococcus pacificus]MBJ8325325.1 sulfatase-like hydrolase/transferase [Streptococcus pacificus]